MRRKQAFKLVTSLSAVSLTGGLLAADAYSEKPSRAGLSVRGSILLARAAIQEGHFSADRAFVRSALDANNAIDVRALTQLDAPRRLCFMHSEQPAAKAALEHICLAARQEVNSIVLSVPLSQLVIWGTTGHPGLLRALRWFAEGIDISERTACMSTTQSLDSNLPFKNVVLRPDMACGEAAALSSLKSVAWNDPSLACFLASVISSDRRVCDRALHNGFLPIIESLWESIVQSSREANPSYHTQEYNRTFSSSSTRQGQSSSTGVAQNSTTDDPETLGDKVIHWINPVHWFKGTKGSDDSIGDLTAEGFARDVPIHSDHLQLLFKMVTNDPVDPGPFLLKATARTVVVGASGFNCEPLVQRVVAATAAQGQREVFQRNGLECLLSICASRKGASLCMHVGALSALQQLLINAEMHPLLSSLVKRILTALPDADWSNDARSAASNWVPICAEWLAVENSDCKRNAKDIFALLCDRSILDSDAALVFQWLKGMMDRLDTTEEVIPAVEQAKYLFSAGEPIPTVEALAMGIGADGGGSLELHCAGQVDHSALDRLTGKLVVTSTSVESNALLFVRMGGMILLDVLARRASQDWQLRYCIARAVGNIALEEMCRDTIDEKWVKRLKGWAARDEVPVRYACRRALLNLEASGEDPRYLDGIFPVAGDHTNSAYDIVFVHGLRGEAFRTWTSRGKVFWPVQWVGKDFPSARIITVGFGADLLLWGGGFARSLQEQGELLRYKLALAQVGSGGRKVVFVTHSMGGLLVKQILGFDGSDSVVGHRFLPSVKGVAFLATPHLGSWLASVPAAVRSLAKTSRVVEDLSSSSPYLTVLNQQMRDAYSNCAFECLSIAEGMRTQLRHSSIKLSLTIVPPEASDPGFGVFFIEPSVDHINIPKPDTRGHPVYKALEPFIRKCLTEEQPKGLLDLTDLLDVEG